MALTITDPVAASPAGTAARTSHHEVQLRVFR
jgi:hypothetical protein